jgi:transporter family-2 protein
LSPVLLILVVVVAGAATGLQSPTNALLTRAFGSPIGSAFVSFAVGTVLLAGAVLAFGIRPNWAAARALPWYAYAGGAYGALFVSAAAFSAPRLGVGFTLVMLIAGQLTAAMLIDNFGMFGLARHPFGLARAGGLALVIAGVILVRRG